MKHASPSLLAAAALIFTASVASPAFAVRSWVLPSSTTLSGPNAWIAVDAATSDQLYIPNLRPLRLDSIEVLDSDGQPVTPQNALVSKFRSTFDVQVTKPGTYRISAVTADVVASYTADGAVKRFRGSAQEFARQVPAGAADLRQVRTLGRFETFVTRDKPTAAVFRTTGAGLEMVPVTHPADIVAGEAARFRFVLDGKPAAGLEVLFARGGDTWKTDPHEIKARTGADGVVSVTLPEGGMWWMSATHQAGETGRGPGPGSPPQPLAGDGYSATYTATVEAHLP